MYLLNFVLCLIYKNIKYYYYLNKKIIIPQHMYLKYMHILLNNHPRIILKLHIIDHKMDGIVIKIKILSIK